jgi:uncharacterized protein YbjQ (UPF0145 family)
MDSSATPPQLRSVLTGLSGNEMYCLRQKGFSPGDIVIGNSVHSMGFLGGIGAGLQSVFGGEVSQVTQIIHEGRQASYGRMIAEAGERGGSGIAGVTSELKHFRGNIEFLSVGSCLHRSESREELAFTSDCDGQELYLLMDAGYAPVKFVFGNVAYSIGVGGGLLGGLKSLARGEIREYSDVFNATRHLALERISREAQAAGANAVLAIETRIMPFQGVHEMIMMGTAARHPALPNNILAGQIITSDLTCEEMWNLANLGYAPLKLVLGTAVYSLGVVGGVMAALKSFVRGEISDLTSLIYDAREHALGLLKREAEALGADDVVGIRTHVHEFQGLIEFMAIGTAVKRLPGVGTLTPTLPPQAIIRDRETWIGDDDLFATRVQDPRG